MTICWVFGAFTDHAEPGNAPGDPSSLPASGGPGTPPVKPIQYPRNEQSEPETKSSHGCGRLRGVHALGPAGSV